MKKRITAKKIFYVPFKISLRLYIWVVFTTLLFQTVTAEIINGPANIRIEPNKEIILSLRDSVNVDCTELKDNWYQIKIVVKISANHYEQKLQIKRGEKLVDLNGHTIGEALADIPSSISFFGTSDYGPGKTTKYQMEIVGYTYNTNIQLNSIAENPLLDLITNNRDSLTLDVFKKYIRQFDFEKNKDDILLRKFFPSLTEYFIYENSVYDPSPMDRIRLIFEKDVLVAIIHSRQLKITNAEQYPIGYGMTLTLFKVPKVTNKKTFPASL